ncbi:MAG TPA: helix-turn-helix domain-containing protein [Polyangia bacterium]|nr:helix-turn-helix domain-containing protein [Polyangia bacterium]
MRVQVLVLDGAFDLGLAAVLDTLTTANDLAGDGKGGPRFSVERVGMRRRARTQQGLSLPLAPAGRGRAPDLIIVPALGCKTPETLTAALARRDVADAGAFLRGQAAAGARVTAACTATFVLAQSGLLDGRGATTTWWLAPLFRERFPRVELDESRMIVESGRFATAGAALAHLDLALWLVRRRSPSLAALTARYLILDARSSQGRYAIPDHLAHSDPIVERFERWARRNLIERFSLEAAARAAGASQRTLARRLHRVLGKSPLAYVQELRVERAVHLLQTSEGSVDEIAAAVGYGDGVTLRALLRRKTGRGVRELRRQA